MTMGMFFWVKKVVPGLIVAADGSGDYTDIQSAIDALPVTGGSIFVKEGTYTITSTIDVDKSNVLIQGSGKASKIQTTSNTPLITVNGVNYVCIRSLYFYGAGNATYASNMGVRITGGSTYCRVDSCFAENCYIGIFSQNSTFITFTGNICYSNKKSGLRMDSQTDCLIIGNISYSNDNHGIMLYSASLRNIISNNHVYSNEQNGILLYSSDNCIITNNMFTDNDVSNTAGYDGIQLFNSDNNHIISNTCRDNDRYEISIEGTSDSNSITGNILIGTDHEDTINDEGTNTHISHNITA